MSNNKQSNLNLTKLANKLDEALSNETTESMNGWLERKRMKNKQKEVDIAELAFKAYPFSNSERNAFISGYNKAKQIHGAEKMQVIKDYFDWHKSMGFVSHKPEDIREFVKETIGGNGE
jgi:hypothetical protein